MRLAFLTPLPPSTSGIADYSAALLEELGKLAPVDAYSAGAISADERSSFQPLSAFEDKAAGYDAILYQLGNSREHAGIYQLLLRHPGIVVLHDGTLHHLVVDGTLHRGNTPAYLREMAYAHGAEGYDAAVQIVRGSGIFPFYRFPLIKRAVDAARGVIVHSQAVRQAVLAARPDVPVHVIDHFSFPPVPAFRTREAMLSALGWPSGALVVASFGQVTHGKRAERVLEAFARFNAQIPHSRLLWVGDFAPEYDLRPEIRRLGLDNRVRLTGRVPAGGLADYLSHCDIAINLRYPTTGEASGAVMRLLAYGKPTLVSNAGWFRELPDGGVAKVEVGPGELQAIVDWLCRLSADRALYSRISVAAQEYATPRTPARAAQEYMSVVRSIMEEQYARVA